MEEYKNKFLKQVLKFLTLKQNLISGLVLIAIFTVAYLLLPSNTNDSNVTWIFSSSMQTLAALIALLPISYSYYINNTEEIKKEDYDSFVIRKLKKDVYYEMMFVIIYSLLVIIFNLLSLYLDYNIKNAIFTVFFTALGIQFLVIYIYRLFDPEKVKNILKELDKTPARKSKVKISLDEYITQYLNLESAVKDYISNENDNELVDKQPLYDIVDNLSKDFPELNKHYDTFKEIIFHRNNLIHNYHDTEVDYEKYQKILELTSFFEKNNQYFITKFIFNNTSSIYTIIETCIKEYMLEAKSLKEMDENYLSDLKDDICSLLHSHFVSDYYFTRSLDDALETDFEVIQNNYSNRKLVGIDIRTVSSKRLHSIADAFFNRLFNRFSFLFLINYNHEKNNFEIIYKTEDLKTRIKTIE